ncbi:flagellar assembly protein FliW [Methylobacter sp. Wu8]|jgi:flagellar assembly factor FliW|uniref:Flagellar assembly factor FliW n=1 Tax=Methylobacter tundripaludum TaxID=173365 RepID=A0A2S6H856_9GAMM|nr:flagellar assembly protein FliW [Methylobacter tundripaludum]MCF7964977.1 flagellar assembly protein FliW [Methylobacter tundripaludum]MCK9637731.1 flagellar assembly protein FliW [Methylobacter tundripaludum]PPK73593.1 flagellar assembly factor FliW [Methylobacter tundripaludum]
MEIKSSFFGQQTIDPNTVLSFPNGIPGFEDQTRFKLFHQEGDNPLIFWLQSLDDESLAFSVTQPSNFNINYNFALNDTEEALLGIEDIADTLILIILHKDESDQPTIKGSIKSPLVINCSKRIGLQKVLTQVEQSITLTDTSNEINVSESV